MNIIKMTYGKQNLNLVQDIKNQTEMKGKFQQLFENRIDYEDKPELLDLAQNTANEVALFEESKNLVFNLFAETDPFITVADFCAGTGLFAEHIIDAANISKIVCVDTDSINLSVAKKRLSQYEDIELDFINEDAITFQSNEPFDLVLMGSAYHHIEDKRKISFLRNARELLKSDGYILVNENFIPAYSDSLESYRESVFTFYNALIKYLKSLGTEEKAINVMRQVAWYGCIREVEFKVSYEIFLKHLKEAKLEVYKKKRVWPLKYPNTFQEKTTGSFSLILKKEEQ